MSARHLLSWLAPVVALFSACSVGEPLVDRFPPPPKKGGEAVSCTLPPDCTVPLVLELSQPAAKDLQWQTCSAACEGALAPDGVIGTGDDIPVLDCVPVEPLASLANDQVCVTARFAMTGAEPPLSAGGNLIANEVVWRDANIVIEADEAVEVIVTHAEVQNTRIDLRGPVTLRFQDQTMIDGLDISSNSPSSLVAFERVAPNALVVGDAAHELAGHLDAQHSSFTASSFVVASVELDSVMIDGAFLASEDLVTNDGALHDVTLDVDRATFAPAALKAVQIVSCESLSFFGSSLRNVNVPSCDGEPTRLYTSDFVSGQLDGEVSGDNSKIEQAHLGLRFPSNYTLWGVSVTSSAFCGNVASVKVSENAVQCSKCNDEVEEPLGAACTLPLGDFERPDDEREDTIANFCEPLDMLEPCPPPVPMRTRPIGMLND